MERLTTLPQVREPPEYVLRGLREIDSTVELVYAGEGLWWLGSVKPSAPRRALAFVLLALARQSHTVVDPASIRKWLLMREGFGLLSVVPEWRLTSQLIEDFRAADWLWRHPNAWAEHERALMDATTGRARLRRAQKIAQEYVATEARSAYRFATGRRRHIATAPRLVRPVASLGRN